MLGGWSNLGSSPSPRVLVGPTIIPGTVLMGIIIRSVLGCCACLVAVTPYLVYSCIAQRHLILTLWHLGLPGTRYSTVQDRNNSSITVASSTESAVETRTVELEVVPTWYDTRSRYVNFDFSLQPWVVKDLVIEYHRVGMNRARPTTVGKWAVDPFWRPRNTLSVISPRPYYTTSLIMKQLRRA